MQISTHGARADAPVGNCVETPVHIMDTTLRDGEQAAYVNFFPEEKLRLARELSDLLSSSDCLDVGFPITSQTEFEAISMIGTQVDRVHLLVLARLREGDIDAAYAALKHCSKRRIALIVPTSPLHRQAKLGMTAEELAAAAVAHVRYARRLFPEVEVGFEDSTRTDPDYLVALAETLIAEGVSCIALPDTVGICSPAEYGALFRRLRGDVSNIADLRYLEAHCHNDLGLALANSIEAIRNGANKVGTSFNGIGERAGNTSTEELLMFFKMKPGVIRNPHAAEYKYEKIFATSQLVSEFSGIRVQPHKPIVGVNCYRHESGIHQDGLLKNEDMYQLFRPDIVGYEGERIVIGKHSGITGLRHKLTTLGLEVREDKLPALLERIKERLTTVRRVSDQDIRALGEAFCHD